MAYQAHSVKILKKNREQADEILLKHWEDGNIDTLKTEECITDDTVTYWINPYIYEDFEAIINEFEENGIEVL